MLTTMSDNQLVDIKGGVVSLCAPAKVNLSLAVFDRRSDGFHDLHTIMSTINLFDDLRLEMSDKPGINLHCSGLDSPAGCDNLVYRAAELLVELLQHVEDAEVARRFYGFDVWHRLNQRL